MLAIKRRNIGTLLVAGGIASIVMVCVMAANAKASETTDSFVQKASEANRFEIESSKLALNQSQNDDVKKFAQHMIDDHTQAGDNLNDAISASNSDIQTADELDSKHQKKLDALSSLSGKDFDTQYVAIQLKAHQKAVALFSDYANHGKDPAIRAFAVKTLPTLKKHLKHVTALQSHQG